MIDRTHSLPITRQAELVGISRGNVYYLPRAASEADQRLMKRIDVLHLAHPFAGARMLRDFLNREGFEVGRRHVATLMSRMGIQALYQTPNTSKKHPGHKVYPYLLRGLKIDRGGAGNPDTAISGYPAISMRARGAPVGRAHGHTTGLPVLPCHPLSCMPSSLPRRNRWVRVSLTSPPMTAFPVFQSGRLPHYPFRGLLNVHSRYGLHDRQVP
jgi:hypothetical protein